MPYDERDDNEERSTGGFDGLLDAVDRRRFMKYVGAGVGSVPIASSVAAAKTDCADGPFESSYEPGTVNVGQIRADQAKGGDPGSIGAASPRDTDRSRSGGQTPGSNAQGSNVDADGPLTIDTEYDGVNSLETRGGVPSDSQIAVGNGKLIHALNRNVAIYNKQAGRREQFFQLERLWEPVIPEPEGGFAFGVPFVFDPRARYDREADRFVLCAVQFEPGLTEGGETIDREDLEEAAQGEEAATDDVARPPQGWFLVAVSASNNPNGKWYVYRIPPEDASGIDNEGLVDYPTLGLDRDAIYLTQNFFGEEFEVTMVTLDKAAMYAGEEVTAHHFDGMSDPDADGLTFTVQPAQMPFAGGSDGTYCLVNSDFPIGGTSGTLTFWELTDPLENPSLECFTLDVDPYVYPLPARQPESDSLIDTLGTRLMNADFNDGSLWTAHSTAIEGEGGRSVAAIRWYEIDVGSPSVIQSGTYGDPARSTYIPTIGSEGDSTIVVHNVSGPDTFARMDVAGRTADFIQDEIEDAVVVQDGESEYNARASPVERWGDYNGFSVDPSSGRFWTVSQYSPDINIPVEDEQRDPYFTRIAEVSFEESGANGDGNGDGNGGGNGNRGGN
jgi:hypothetical protein